MPRKHRASRAVIAVVLLATTAPAAGQAASPTSTPNLTHTGSVAYPGGSDIEFMKRTEAVARTVTSYKTVRTKRVSCRSRGVRCRRGQRTKLVRTRPRRVAVRRTVIENVTRSYALAGSLASFAPGEQVGLRIVDITDPSAPRVAAFYTCQSNQLDIQTLQRGDRTYVILGLDYGPSARSAAKPSRCHSDLGIDVSEVGVAVVDVTDPASPRGIAFAPIPAGAHNSTIHPGGRYLYVSDSELEGPLSRGHLSVADPAQGPVSWTDPEPYSMSRIQIVDLADVTHPAMVAEVDVPGWGSSHDITFSADGRRAYSAALTQTNIFDTTDPLNPRLISSIVDPEINIHHQSDPYRIGDKEYLVITDEIAGAAGNGYCPGGGLHVYDITDEMVPLKVSRFVIPMITTAFDKEDWIICTSHVLRIYPEQKILTIAWYTAGIWVIDVSDPSAFKAVGFADPTGTDGRQTDVWSAKMLDGHIYTNDLARGMDVYRYTGPAAEVTVLDAVEAYAGLSRPQRTVDFMPRAEDGRPLFCFEVAKGRSLI